MHSSEYHMLFKCALSPIFGLGYKYFGKRSGIVSPLIIRNKKYIHIGKSVRILKGARLECYDTYADHKYKPNLVIEDKVNIGYNFQCLVTSNCRIGDHSLLASNILISTENHGMDPTKIYSDQPLTSGDVNIGRNCWIGERVIILPGVTLGDNVIVGGGSVVTHSFGDNVIIAGNPGKIIKSYDFNNKKWEGNPR